MRAPNGQTYEHTHACSHGCSRADALRLNRICNNQLSRLKQKVYIHGSIESIELLLHLFAEYQLEIDKFVKSNEISFVKSNRYSTK